MKFNLYAKKCIKKESMPSSLAAEFRKNGMEHLLEKVHIRTAELVQENYGVDKALRNHLQQILPCIAFYEVLVDEKSSKEEALELYGRWCLLKVEKMAKLIPVIMKVLGLYKLMPKLFNKMLDGMFGEKAGFRSRNISTDDGFSVEMTVCPYVEMCCKYNCLEIAQYFCKSDDICYGNMHPKLIWGRTETLGTGGDCCDFKLHIKKTSQKLIQEVQL